MPFDTMMTLQQLKESLYYFNSSSETDYTSVGGGNFCVDRFFEGHLAYWEAPSGKREKQKKTLILYSPSPTQWSPNRARIAMERFEMLIAEGFALYVYKGNKVTPLNTATFIYENEVFQWKSTENQAREIINSLFMTTEVEEKEMIRSVTEQLSLSRDQVAIITQAQIEILIDGDDNDWKKEGAFSSCVAV